MSVGPVGDSVCESEYELDSRDDDFSKGRGELGECIFAPPPNKWPDISSTRVTPEFCSPTNARIKGIAQERGILETTGSGEARVIVQWGEKTEVKAGIRGEINKDGNYGRVDYEQTLERGKWEGKVEVVAGRKEKDK